MKNCDFFEAVATWSDEMNSYYKDCIIDRTRLFEFMEMNDWFDLHVKYLSQREKLLLREKPFLMRSQDIQQLRGRIEIWLSAYKKTNYEKLKILEGLGKRLVPATTKAYMSFLIERKVQNEQSSWQLLDYLLGVLHKELIDLSDEEIEELLNHMETEIPLTTSMLFASFYENIQQEKQRNGWVYRFSSRATKGDNRAYPVREFSIMAYCIFNNDYWEREKLIEKACKSSVYANLWAFLAMHFVCALRATDIERLPMPDLPVLGNKFREMILEGNIEDTGSFAREMQIRLRYKPMKPRKTQVFSSVPEIKVFIPTSLEKPLGTILAIAASYCKDGQMESGFIKPSRRIAIIRRFFGKTFSDALQGKNFASRRANKAYLQGIEVIGDTDEASAPKGYMLAALARSHRGGIGTLPDITEVYLKDAAFSGYTPEFIAREMFERGVFGFVPHLLLETLEGNNYKGLSVEEKTALIKEIGITPSGIEELVRLNDRSLMQAREIVKSVVTGKEEIPVILQRIASGNAVGKQDGVLCLMMACGYTCCYPENSACVGCRYEIHTKSMMHHMVGEYSRMRRLCVEKDGWRYKKLIEKSVLPPIGELLKTVRQVYPNSDMDFYAEIMEGGMAGYDSGSESNAGRELFKVSDDYNF